MNVCLKEQKQEIKQKIKRSTIAVVKYLTSKWRQGYHV